jgi:glycerol dehydrogenase
MRVFGAPGRYLQGPGLLGLIGPEIARLGGRAALVVDIVMHDQVVAQVEPSCVAAGVTLDIHEFQGELTPATLHALVEGSRAFAPNVVIGAGGGKAIDAAKGVSRAFSSAMVSMPTTASNDAPTSAIFVLYDDDHRLLSVEKLGRNPDLVVVDTALLVRAPRSLFLSGIGDALVKRFEVARCVEAGGSNVFGGTPLAIATVLADHCYTVVRSESETALAAVDRGIVDEAFERVVEATVLLSGLAFENGGLSIAHSMTRGLPAVRSAGRQPQPHGFQVAYALLVQLVLEDRGDGILADLIAFYRRIGLPATLHDIGLGQADDAALANVAALTLKAAHSANFPRRLTVEEMVVAMRRTATF